MWVDLGKSLLIDLVSTLIILPVVTGAALYVLRLLPNRRIWAVRRVPWRLDAASFPTIVVSTSSFQETPRYRRPQTGIGQVRAIAAIAPSLSRAYGTGLDNYRLRMSFDCDLADPLYHGDLVTIGGPKTNEVTRLVLERIAAVLPEGFSFETARDGDGTSDRIVWEGATVDGATPGEVHGVVIRCANPLGRRGILTVLAGMGTFGTEAAAVAITTDPRLRPGLSESLHRTRFAYVALVRGEITERASGIPRLHRCEVEGIIKIPWEVP